MKARKKLDSPKQNAPDFCHGSVGNKYFLGKLWEMFWNNLNMISFGGAGAIFLMYMQTFD